MELAKKDRPKTLEGSTSKIGTGCGSLYVTVAGDNGFEPMEVFAHLGKAGGCSNCQNEALTRVISLGLRYGVPVQEYIEALRGIRCPNPYMVNSDKQCLSCPDGIATALEEYISEDTEG